jgi:CDP-diacylglycerol--serine O-phosphatidyltransferase
MRPLIRISDSGEQPDDPRRSGAAGAEDRSPSSDTANPAPRPHKPKRLRRFRRQQLNESIRERRRLRIRRHGRRAYIRSVYSLPSLATLGNAICGFGAMYVASMDSLPSGASFGDNWTNFFAQHHFMAAAYLIFLAMLFDAVDGRLARFTRHTTDFGGQLDSLADVISFGCAPAFLALQVFHDSMRDMHHFIAPILGRLIWAIGALYTSCAAIRLARFNVSNEHGEQHHFSFLGLPSPGAGGAVAAFVLMQQDLAEQGAHAVLGAGGLAGLCATLSTVCLALLPAVVLMTGLLMVSAIRYPHLVNRYLRGRRSIGRLLGVVAVLLLLVIAHRYTLGIGTLLYALWGLASSSYVRLRPRAATAKGEAAAGARPSST